MGSFSKKKILLVLVLLILAGQVRAQSDFETVKMRVVSEIMKRHVNDQEIGKLLESRQVLSSALKFWCANDFICENWWHNQIGTPTSLVAVLLIMEDELDPELKESALKIIGRANLNVSGARQGGDLFKVGGIEAKRGLVVGDEARFGQIMQAINDEIRFTTGDSDPDGTLR